MPKLDRSIISLSKITHQMQDHPYNQRNKTSKIEVEVKVGGYREEGLDETFKRCGREYRGFITYRVLGTLPQL